MTDILQTILESAQRLNSVYPEDPRLDKAWDKDRFDPLVLPKDWKIQLIPHEEVRMCFVTDNDGHWYLISEGMRDLFKTLLEDIKDEDSPKWNLWYENFEKCRCSPPTAYTFLDAKEMK